MMRSNISRSILLRVGKRAPWLFRRIQLQVLMDFTARAFGQKSRRVLHLPSGRGLKRFATFSRDCMDHSAADPEQLYRQAYALGARIRSITGLTDQENLQKLVFLLYRNIGITMGGDLPGEITVSRCYFSRFYSPEQCALMSAVDSGIISGIFGGGRLRFTQRITEGCKCCKACMEGDRNE